MNIFIKFQPHVSKTDIITASKVYCCSLSVTVCTHDRFFEFLVDFFQANNVLGSFFELYRYKNPKTCAASPNRWFRSVTSFDLVTSDDLRSVKWSKTANQWLKHEFYGLIAVTPAKLHKLTLQTHLQIGTNNFTLTWPVNVTDDLEVNLLCFSSMNFPGLSIDVFAFPIRCAVSELGGGGWLKMTPQRLVGGEEALRLPG